MKKLKLSVIFIFGLFSLCFADESITVTTYYPSPYGEYNELGTNRLAVGDTNNDGTLDAADQPNRDGDIRLKAQTGNPSSWPAGTIGQIAYSRTNDSLYHYNGSAWVASGGGGGGCYVSYSGSCLAGFTDKGSAGFWGHCSGYGDSFFRPPGGACYGGWSSYSVGEARVCCQ